MAGRFFTVWAIGEALGPVIYWVLYPLLILKPTVERMPTFPFLMFGNWSLEFSSVAQSCPTLCGPMDCSTPDFPVHHRLPELAQTHVHWVRLVICPRPMGIRTWSWKFHTFFLVLWAPPWAQVFPLYTAVVCFNRPLEGNHKNNGPNIHIFPIRHAFSRTWPQSKESSKVCDDGRCNEIQRTWHTQLHLPEKQEKTRGNHSLPRVLPCGWRIGWGQGYALPKDGTPRWTGLVLVYRELWTTRQMNVHGEPGGWTDAWELTVLHCACLQLGSTHREWAEMQTQEELQAGVCLCVHSLWCLVFTRCVCMCVELSMVFKVLFKQDGFLTGWGFWRWWYSGFLEPSRTISRWISEVIFSFSFSLSRISYFLAGPP